MSTDKATQRVRAEAILAVGGYFEPDLDADISGTGLVGTYQATYDEMHGVLGSHGAGDDYKVSTEWVLRGSVGGKRSVWTIYDWKETSLYEEGLPTPDAFRKANAPPYDWHIGGQEDPAGLKALVAWLDWKLGRR